MQVTHLKHLANQERVTYPTAAHFIIHDLYVDDGLTSVESREEAKELIEGAREVCSITFVDYDVVF